jgi:hypothetical protein
MQETLAMVEDLITTGRYGQHMCINTAKLVSLRDDARLREIVERCDLVNADGQGVVWASRLLGDPLPERVAGIDLMEELLGLAARKGYRVYVLGATPACSSRAGGMGISAPRRSTRFVPRFAPAARTSSSSRSARPARSISSRNGDPSWAPSSSWASVAPWT